MAYEIINTLRSKSTIRVTGNTSTRINISQLSADVNTETVISATISHIITTSDGAWNVYRGDSNSGILIMQMFGTLDYPLSENDIVMANSATSNIFVENTGTGGTLILVTSKSTEYPTPLIN